MKPPQTNASKWATMVFCKTPPKTKPLWGSQNLSKMRLRPNTDIFCHRAARVERSNDKAGSVKWQYNSYKHSKQCPESPPKWFERPPLWFIGEVSSWNNVKCSRNSWRDSPEKTPLGSVYILIQSAIFVSKFFGICISWEAASPFLLDSRRCVYVSP